MEPIPETSEAVEEYGPFSTEEGDLLAELREKAERVRGLVPECIGLSLASKEEGVSFTLVASDEEIAALDAIQYVGGGPCVESVNAERVLAYTHDEMLGEANWQLFAQATAAQYLKAGRMPDTLVNIRKVYGERARAMGAALARELSAAIEFTQPEGGLFFWARLTGHGGKSQNAGEFAKRAIEKGVAFVPGAPFYAAEPDTAAFRLSFATADVGKIEEGVGRLGLAL